MDLIKEKIRKKHQIKEIKEGDIINDIFVVKIKKALRPYAKGHGFSLILSDSTGSSIEYKYWGGHEEEIVRRLFDSIKNDSVIFVNGKASIYNGKLEINADEFNILKVLLSEEYDADFIPKTKRDIEEMYAILLSKIDSITNKEIKDFINGIMEEKGQKLKIHPGAISIHHNWRGGLLEHVLEIIEYCETSCKIYPELDRDLLITGAILHDIGKLEEIETTSRIKGTQKGQLVGHLILGISYISKKLDESRMDDLTKDKILHLITSHHGKIEQGSPKEPMIPEAIALYYADELSSKIRELLGFIEQSRETTEDDFMYHPSKGRNIFLK